MGNHYANDKELAVSIVNTYIASVNPEFQTKLTVDDIVDMLEKVHQTLISLTTPSIEDND